VFGKRQNPFGEYAAVIPKFIKQLLGGETPVINGDGSQTRDFTYIENVIEANLKACLASSSESGEVFNIAFGESNSISFVYEVLCRELKKEITPVFSGERAGDIKHSKADISKAKKFLGYEPEYDFARGISEAIEWYKNNL
jgi:UDP-N-acetylglucosamine 4-epimerase